MLPVFLIINIVTAAWPLVKDILKTVYDFYVQHEKLELDGQHTEAELTLMKEEAREEIVKQLIGKGFKEGDARIAVEVALKVIRNKEQGKK